jgi:multidrug efflux pump subunit AcrA (membrane-fusion protein)
MATRDADLSSLRIDRSSPGAGTPRNSSIGKIIAWSFITIALLTGAIFLKDIFRPRIEVQLVTASLSSPSQANAILTASGYVVARRKAAVASKGTGTLVFLGVEEGDRV